MNNKIAMYGLFALGATALFGSTLATSMAAEDTTNYNTECDGSMLHRGGQKYGPKFEQRLEVQSEILGLSVDEIKALHEEGKRMPEILEDQGIDFEVFHEAMKTKHIEFINAEVAAGNMTQKKADGILERMENHVPGERPEFSKGGRGMYRGQGFEKIIQE